MAKIVVVDDTELLRRMLTDVLRKHGHTVFPAEDGLVALKLVRSVNPDLLVTDYYMPVMDGAELTKAIRRGEAGRTDLPILALAGSLHAERSTAEAGVTAYLSKPLHEATLIDTINSLLAGESHHADH